MRKLLEKAARISKAIAAGIGASAGAYSAAEIAGSVGFVEALAIVSAGLGALALTYGAPKNA